MLKYKLYLCFMILKALIISVILLAISFIALAFRILFVREGKFPEGSISKNKEMAKLGITCARHEELKCWNEGKSGDLGCGCSHA
jgi:hypothetical protein